MKKFEPTIWAELIDSKNYCTKNDYKIIQEFNKKEKERKEKFILKYGDTKKDKDFKIRLDFIAEPYFGNLNANIVLLAGNPGISQDEQEKELYKKDPQFKKDIIKYHKEGCMSIDYPYYYFNDDYDKYPGNKWAKSRLLNLKEESNLDWKELSKKFLYLQYFPYHSKNFKKTNPTLEVQQTTFDILSNAIEEKKIIILLRSRQLWEKAVPKLIGYPNLILLKQNKNGWEPRSIYSLKKEMLANPDKYKDIIKALK